MHAPDRHRAGYTLIEVIGAVVIGAILLTLAVPAIAHAVRVRTAEATLKNDLRNAANSYEQAYLSERKYPASLPLQLSPQVAVDSQAVSGERVYLRLRHVPTGQLCVLDYSRSSAVARNRPDCYSGGLDRDTALTVTAEAPPAAPSDTFGVSTPAAPATPANPLALASPTIDNPPAQTAAPGASLSQAFTVTNRSPLTRSFRFETGSSSPAIVATPVAPGSVTLPPNVPTPVTVPYTVTSDALADASSVIPLRVIDAEDERWTATGSFTVSTSLAVAAPSVTVGGAGDRVEDAGQPFDVSWTVTNRTNGARMLVLSLAAGVPAHAEVLSADGTGRLPFAPGQSRTVTARVRLAASSDGGTRSTVSVAAVDADAPAYRGDAAVGVETRTVLAAPSIAAPASRTADPGAPFTLSWTIRNESNAPRAFDVVASVEDPSHLAIVSSTGAGSQMLARGQSVAVSVTYRVLAGSIAGRTSSAALQVTDRAAPEYQASAQTSIGTNIVLGNPTVVAPAAVAAKPDEEFVVSWSVRNGANAPRVLVVDPGANAGAELTLVSATGAGDVQFDAFEARAVTARYRVNSTSLAGAKSAPELRASDKFMPILSGSGQFDVTTAAAARAPTLSAPADQAADPGSAGTVAFRLANHSNLPRTFVLAAASGNPAAVADPADPGPVTIPAFGTADVVVGVAVPSAAVGFTQGAVVLRASDSGDTSLGASAQFAITVNALYLPPSLRWAGPRTARPGIATSDSATLVNRSNVALDFCFAASAAAGSVQGGKVVAGAPAAPACQTVGPAGTASVPVSYAIAAGALAGWTNMVSLTATQRSPVPMAATADLSVAAALVLGAPTWAALPNSPVTWNVGDQRDLAFSFQNTSNGARAFCVEVTSADSRRLSSLTPNPVCGVRADPGETVQVTQAMRVDGAGTGLAVDAVVYDQDSTAYRADSVFYNLIRDTRPTAVWDAPKPVYVRRWAAFDGSRSWSPVGSPITKYIWTWGLFMQTWDPVQGRFVATGTWGTARDEVPDAIVQRAYDYQGTFEVCLVVEDAAGRVSDPNCQSITTIRSTVARLAWRYRGWWSNKDFCIDVWWANNCDPEHGNSRWEIDLRPSIGDVQIQQAYAEFTVNLYNTDDPDLSTMVYYAGNSGTTPAWGSYSFLQDAPEAVGKAQDGRWRVLNTTGTAAYGWPTAPNLGDHPLALNINLASATGIFDGGPHWVPDGVWITLHVQDADGRWTKTTAYHDHLRTSWTAAYDTTVVAETPPSVTVNVASLGSGRFRGTGSEDSPEGRIVDAWWEISYEPIAPGGPYNPSRSTARGTTVDVQPARCERALLTYVVVDDHGLEGRAYAVVDGPGGTTCFPTGGPL
jgi:Tfp pilus assembly protein PilE